MNSITYQSGNSNNRNTAQSLNIHIPRFQSEPAPQDLSDLIMFNTIL